MIKSIKKAMGFQDVDNQRINPSTSSKSNENDSLVILKLQNERKPLPCQQLKTLKDDTLKDRAVYHSSNETFKSSSNFQSGHHSKRFTQPIKNTTTPAQSPKNETNLENWILLKNRNPKNQEYFADEVGAILLKEIPSIAVLINSIVNNDSNSSDIEMEFLIKLLQQISIIIGKGSYSLELTKFYAESCVVPINRSNTSDPNMSPTNKVIAEIQKFFPPEISSTKNLKVSENTINPKVSKRTIHPEYEILYLDTNSLSNK